MDERIKIILSDNASILAAKHYKRDYLRGLCTEYGIYFSLRYKKLKLARFICDYWIEKGELDRIRQLAIEAKAHWQERIDKKDAHRPYYYIDMRDRAKHVLDILEGQV